MDNREKILNEIKHELDEQERIVNLVQSTKMYHVVEGVHTLRKKNNLFGGRSEQIGASVKHILGNTDYKIQKNDALTVVKENNKLISEKIDQLQVEYEKLYNAMQEKMSSEKTMLCENLHLLKK